MILSLILVQIFLHTTFYKTTKTKFIDFQNGGLSNMFNFEYLTKVFVEETKCIA